MNIRGSRADRCSVCQLHPDDCLCPQLLRYAPATRFVLYVHTLELRRPSNTGRLVSAMLPATRRMVHGGPREALEPATPISLPTEPPPLVLHPDGRPLDPSDGEHPRCLLLPDGTWAQARRMLHRIPALLDHELVCLPPRPPSPWWLRRGPRGDHVCTLEAVARAIGLLESEDIERGMLSVLRELVKRTRRRRFLRTGHHPEPLAEAL